ncbi:amino acid ABC transporter substrate-binding protein [Raoultella planticola]|uniref:Amino acid ABC transporter substrate-binding protein n=1 Tax=Raoultella planticola TaxID=575 RepID=A0A443VFA3_RAOPL|nr:transporter substrate-binding domain-containing protein [Raoultella planticola]RWT16104.1 amino acid ABC transporter substrate-binding protein [Raoultella planticola]
MALKHWLTQVCIALSAVSMFTHAATLEQIQAKGVMTVATEDDYRPFEYIEDGKPVGLDHALLEQLRKTSKFKIEQNIMPWSGLLPGVTTGKYDVALTAVVVTPERARSLDFTMPIAEATQYYVVRAKETEIKSVADLSGKIVGVQAGGGSFAALENLQKTLATTGGTLGKVVQYPSFPDAYQDLANGRVDYVINGAPNLASLVKEQPTRFKLGTAVGTPTFAAWAVAKGNTSLLNYLNEFLSKARADGSLFDLQRKWLGMTFESMPVNPVINP